MGEQQTANRAALRTRVMPAGWVGLVAPGIVPAADSTPRGPFNVWAIGLPNGYVVMERQAAVIHVTADDVAQGALHVRFGSQFVITTDTATGYTVDYRGAGKLFRAVEVEGIGRVVELGPAGGRSCSRIPLREDRSSRSAITLSWRRTSLPAVMPGR